MLNINSIYKEFTTKKLFEDLSFRIEPGMRLGLVGPNGSGKSTLLKIILGIDSPDSGSIVKGKSVSIGYLPQEIIPGTKKSILEETLSTFPLILELEKKINNINHLLLDKPDDKKLINKLESLQQQFEQNDGWNIERNAKSVLSGLGFSKDDLTKPFNSFSGGWRMRCYLAGILLQKPNYLFLDEPTNHLDLNALIWMESFLSKWQGGLILISHDRMFLDKSINNILELDQGQAKLYKGNYSSYLKKCEEIKLQLEKELKNQKKTIAKTEKFIEKFRYKNTKAKQVQSRIKQLEKIERIESFSSTKKIAIQIPQPDRGPLNVVQITNLDKSFGEKQVYNNLNLNIERGQKIGLVGINGAGKSTLLKLLAKVEKPSGGNINFNNDINVHYFAQHQIENLDLESTIFESVYALAGAWTESRIRGYLGSFLFHGDKVNEKIRVLSGGEKSRLAFARLLVEPANLILLDEPTNHLDIESRDIIEKMFTNYNGTIVCISHDRHFLNSVTNCTIEVENNNIKKYLGNYDYYEWKKDNSKIDNSNLNKETKNSNVSKKDIYKKRKLNLNRLQKIELRTKEIEIELHNLENKLKQDTIGSDYETLLEFSNLKDILELEYLELIEEKEHIEDDLTT